MNLRSSVSNLDSLTDLYRLTVEKAPYGIFIIDGENRCLYVNETGCRLSGYAFADLLGLDVTALLPEDLRDRGRALLRQAHAGALHGVEMPIRPPDGQQRWCAVDVLPLGEERLLCYAIDITERRRLDEDLARESRRLNRASELARVGWWELDLSSGLVTASDHAGEIYGSPQRRRATLTEVQRLPVPEYRGYLDQALRDLLEQGQPYDVTYRIRRYLDGKLADIRSIAEYDRASNCVFGTLQDITDHRQAEQALRESEARLRAIFDSARDFIYMKDHELRYTHVNQACRDFFQRPLAEIIGRQDGDLFPVPYADQNEASDRLVLAGEVHRGVCERRLHGQSMHLETIKVPILNDSGEVVGLCGVSRDITELRRLEQQLLQAQKMEVVGRLAGGVAHDFNNLLTPILGFADLLLQEQDASDPRRHDLQAIVRAAERARDLTAQLLAFGRKQVLDVQQVDLNELVRESETMLRRLLRENIRLDIVLAPALGKVRGDVSQLHNVLINLVVNAADAMPDGGRILIETQNVDLDAQYVRAHPGSQPGPSVMLAVSDEGCGMDQETLGMIFEPFFTTKEVYAGTGLGLATVDGIVKQHQGSVQVESEPQQGSVFRVYLPRVAAEAKPRQGPCETPRLQGQERILLVEDDSAVRNLAAMALARFGYAIVPADSPNAALELLAAGLQPCQLLLADVVMPGLNGVQLHRTLQDHWPAVPALFMSGYCSKVIAHHGILDPGMHFIQKPFTPQDLAARVREVLDGRGRHGKLA